jgi:hypothetical protein
MGSRSSGAAAILESVNGSPDYLGVIAGDGSVAKTAATTSSAFTIPAGQRIMLQGDVAFWVIPTPTVAANGQSVTAAVASATNGVKIAQGDLYEICLRTLQTDVSVISVSGAFSVKVWRKD